MSAPGRPNNGAEACGCCAGIVERVPEALANRPGLDALRYRVGSHGTFFEGLLARLTTLPWPGGESPLRALTTRSPDDPAIALLDAWALVADVLTFYQERFANEGFVRTATERRSLVELARLVGYRPRPGVSASVHLAFEVEDDYEIEIPVGTRAQSVPAKAGELPQFFETSEVLAARGEWSELEPRLTRPQTLQEFHVTQKLCLKGITTNLKPADVLMLPNRFARVSEIEIDAANERTEVTLQPWSRWPLLDSERLRKVKKQISTIGDRLPEVHEVWPRDVPKVISSEAMPLLEGLSGAARERESLEELHREIRHTRAMVGSLHEAQPDRATKVRGWLTNLDNDLVVIEETLATEEPEDVVVVADDALVDLGTVVSGLAVAPSQPPASASDLTRTVADAFEAKTEAGLKLVSTFTPAIQTTLFTALSGAKVTTDPALVEVYAPRVTAVPFGANAPLKPVLDDQGVPVDQEEWPIWDAVTWGIRLDSDGLHVSLRDREGLFEISTPLSPNTPQLSLTLRTGVEVKVTGTFAGAVRSKISFTLPLYWPPTIDLIFPAQDSAPLKVAVAGETPRRVRRSETLRYSIGANRVEASLARRDSEIAVTVRSPQPAPNPKVLTLDAVYDRIKPETYVLVDRGGGLPQAKLVRGVKTVGRAAYGISGKVTELTLGSPWLDGTERLLSDIRQVTVYAQTESLVVAESPITDDVEGDRIELDGLYDGLEAGRWLIVTGERSDIEQTEGVQGTELVMLTGIHQDVQKVINGTGYGLEEDRPGETIHTFLTLAKGGLSYSYKRDTVKIYANVVKATHGETRGQVLGSADGSQSHQSFDLAFRPLTHVAAATPAGAESTLEVRVDGVEWAASLDPASLGPKDRAFVTQTDDDDITTVTFGDGRRGARLPSGMENVVATYRQGIGKAANLAAEGISQLASQPLGVKGVINPLAASGGADRDGRDAIRRNAPLGVIALDRLVSVSDYADFARTFAGIDKAAAVCLTNGRRQVVHVTVAGADDIAIDTGSDLYRNLCLALRKAGDPHQPIEVEPRELLLLFIEAGVRVAEDYLWELVEPQVRSALLEAFSFERRSLGQDVLLSEVVSVIQAVPGVVYVDVDKLDSVSESVPADEIDDIAVTLGLNPRVAVEMASAQAAVIQPAQLAYLSPTLTDTLILKEITS